jgi:ABC-type nickel/cobalt efflux system permease component RcnA
MPLMMFSRWTIARIAALGVALLAVIGVLDCLVSAAHAQNPFGAPRPAMGSGEASSGIIGWLLAKQSEFYRQISSAVRAAKADGSAVWSLLAISFAYGIFHAAGPGHGKMVISSYLVANEETARRGIVLSFASALAQALVAIAIVGIGALLLNATARTMCSAERVIEIASYALIAAFGARLVWSKGGGLLRALKARREENTSSLVPALAAGPDHHGQHDHVHARAAHDDHGHHHHAHHHGHHDHGHVHDEHCGHSHGPQPSELAGPGGWARGLSAVLTVGIRPCSGAILVLVFALAQGLFWAGVAATFVMGLGTAITVAAIALVAVSARGVAERLSAARDGGGMVIMRGLEFAAAGLVLLFGLGLLLGYLAAERTTCLQ